VEGIHGSAHVSHPDVARRVASGRVEVALGFWRGGAALDHSPAHLRPRDGAARVLVWRAALFRSRSTPRATRSLNLRWRGMPSCWRSSAPSSPAPTRGRRSPSIRAMTRATTGPPPMPTSRIAARFPSRCLSRRRGAPWSARRRTTRAPRPAWMQVQMQVQVQMQMQTRDPRAGAAPGAS
jgi:hypothetical protein